jgi:uncharacterized OB-fold protein
MTLPLLKPSLYAVDAGGQPVLLGGRCTCGHTFFPMQTYRCERCGKTGDALTPIPLATRGRLLATATVYMNSDPSRAAPFVIAAIELDDGPVVRTLLDETPAATIPAVRRQRRVRAVLEAVRADDHDALDLRFRLDTDGATA